MYTLYKLDYSLHTHLHPPLTGLLKYIPPQVCLDELAELFGQHLEHAGHLPDYSLNTRALLQGGYGDNRAVGYILLSGRKGLVEANCDVNLLDY